MKRELRQVRYFILFLILACLATFICLAYIKRHFTIPADTAEQNLLPTNTKPEVKQNQPTQATKNPELPATLLLNIPFTPQAPTGNWDELHNEACEEASAIMANAYFTKQTASTLNPDYVEQEIKKLTEWQDQNFRYHLDTTSEETAKMISEVYNLNTEVITEINEEAIKQALSKNKLVIISTDGRLLGNPNYKQPGPPHHMLVIRGFNEKGFITNDSGTKRGLNYTYTFPKLYNASGDWNHTTKKVETANKKIIIVSK